MKTDFIKLHEYLDAAEVFHWAFKEHYIKWFFGEKRKRHQRTEKALNKLVKKGKLRSFIYGKKMVYSLTRKAAKYSELGMYPLLLHGLGCSECLVRLYRSRPNGIAVAEKYFRKLGSVPECGILYPDGKMLLLEFSTKSNFLYSGLMKSKLDAYRRNLSKIESKFEAKAIVLFVLNVPRDLVKRFVSRQLQAGSVADSDQSAPYGGDAFPSDPFFFTDYETFLMVPFGRQLKEPIYFWMDGNTYPLEKDV